MIAARPVSKIYLVGFMGAGKTTLGRPLADRLGWTFVDLDAEIEAVEGSSIVRVFEEKGESYFREIERRVLAEVSARSGNLVIACGGGAFCTAENQIVMHAHGITVWLDRPFERVWQHRGALGSVRPLLAVGAPRQSSDEAHLRALYEQRIIWYKAAMIHLPVGEGELAQALDRLLGTLAWHISAP